MQPRVQSSSKFTCFRLFKSKVRCRGWAAASCFGRCAMGFGRKFVIDVGYRRLVNFGRNFKRKRICYWKQTTLSIVQSCC